MFGVRLAAAAIAVVAALAATSPAFAAATAESLYVQRADGGKLGAKKLVLKGIARRVDRFDDRPRRTAGTLPLTRFVRQWKSTFRGAPPNAALVVDDAPRGRDIALLELRRPRYDARRDTLTFAVRRLKETRADRLRGYGRRADGDAVTRFGAVSLFIDPGTAEPVLIMTTATVPVASTVVVSFSGSTFDYDYGKTILDQTSTPAVDDQYGAPTNSLGKVTLAPTRIAFNASPGIGGAGGGFMSSVLAALVPPSSGAITGTATVPAGASLTLQLENEAPQNIPNGPFTLQ